MSNIVFAGVTVAETASPVSGSGFKRPAAARTARFFLVTSTLTGTTPTLDIKIQARSGATWFDVADSGSVDAAFAQQTSSGNLMLTINDHAPGAAGVNCRVALPNEFRCVATITGSGVVATWTVTVDYGD